MIGPARNDTRATAAAMFRAGLQVSAIARAIGVNRPAIYRALRNEGLMPPYAPRKPENRIETTAWRSLLDVRGRDHAQPNPALRSALPDVPCFRCGARGWCGHDGRVQ